MKPVVNLRRASQLYFLLFYIAAGLLFYKAVLLLPVIGAAALEYRFPAVEAFLPISALLALKQWLALGIWDDLHPAGLTILLLALLSALLFKRGFCSHLCPIGTASEWFYQLRLQLVPQQLPMNRYLHYVLLVPKYAILAFFLYVIVIAMPVPVVTDFLRSPYNAISDVKMLAFFTEPSIVTLEVVALLVLLSLAVPNFWCRYLCPYGALLNLFAVFSPIALKRNAVSCIDCKRCDQACPNGITVSTAASVSTPECTLCQSCIKSCPQANTLAIQAVGGYTLKPWHYSALLIGLFICGIGLAKIAGYWESPLLGALWVKFVPLLHSLGHP